MVPTNKWSTIQLNEINYGVFFVKDMDEGEHGFEYNKLRNDVDIISVDVNNHKLSADQKFAEIDANIEYLSDEISTKWEATCLSADNLCIALSNEIEVTNTEIEYLSYEISGNMLCTELSVSNLNGRINELSTHHADHYDKTFVETESLSGPDKTFDSLKITDCDDTNNKYKLIFKDGTLVLEKVS